MTVRFYTHSIAKRAEGVALVDLGATENFMNLTYAKWLKLPIKNLEKPRKLFNVDSSLNKSGNLKYYTDLEVQTGTGHTNLWFFLSDLGEHKAILGYPWFAAVQPKINWKQGWIDASQLPIILQAIDAKRACFLPRTRNILWPIHHDQYYIGRVTIRSIATPETNPAVPDEYHRHTKVFSEEASHQLPKHMV